MLVPFRIFFLLILVHLQHRLQAQDVIYAQIMPTYRTGHVSSVVNDTIRKYFEYPKEMLAKGLEGIVLVQVMISKEGTLSEARVIKGLNEAADKETLRVVRLLQGWTPGQKDNKPIDCKLVLPVQFKLPK